MGGYFDVFFNEVHSPSLWSQTQKRLLKLFNNKHFSSTIVFMRKEELIYFAKRMYEKGLSPATSGNISVLEEDKTVLISKSGGCLGELDENGISKIDFEGNIISGPKPSSEKFMHIEIYKKRSDIKAIIHSHTPELLGFSACNFDINKPITPDFALYFGYIPTAKYFLPGSLKLAHEVSLLFEKHNTVLMKNHGVIIGAKSLKEAYYLLESLIAHAKALIYANNLGKIQTLNKKETAEIEKLKQ